MRTGGAISVYVAEDDVYRGLVKVAAAARDLPDEKVTPRLRRALSELDATLSHEPVERG